MRIVRERRDEREREERQRETQRETEGESKRGIGTYILLRGAAGDK